MSKAPAGTSEGPIRRAVMFVRAVLRRFQVDDATFLAGGVAFTSAGRSHSCRLNGPSAFFRVL
ncbi:MAG: hypothetical protein ACKOFX_03895 [Solirubrobacterales bacterium]